MRLTVYQADKGDCLLLSSQDGKTILADGGMRSSFRDHVAGDLGKLRDQGRALDLVYVSHIDQDHIAGVLELMDLLVAWRVFDFQRGHGNPGFPEPDGPRPPEVRSIWHNSFHEQVGRNAGPIEEMLAANASLLSASDAPWASGLARISRELATSMAEAVQLSRRVGVKQLGIPLNQEYGGSLMFVADPAETIPLGSLRISVIGPFAEDLATLRRDWNRWLGSQKGKDQLRRIREEARRQEARLGVDEFRTLVAPILTEARQLGDRDLVTPPNLASLMLLVEEGKRSVLMTGDGHADDILYGLDACGKLDDEDSIHVDVLKVQHHGSEHNTTREFCRRVTADHYIFCGNGAHENPNLEVLDAYVESRLGPVAKRSPNAQAGNPFKLWFNASSGMSGAKFPEHMREVEHFVDQAVASSGGKMSCRFLRASKFDLTLGQAPGLHRRRR